MIITIFSEVNSAERSILAVNLATLCALNHRKALLIDATSPRYSLIWSKQHSASGVKPKVAVYDTRSLHSELGNSIFYYRTHYREIIIDTDGIDSLNAESALIAAHVLVVPIWSYQGDLSRQENLIQRIERIRLFNPALPVLVVDVRAISAFSDTPKREFDAAAIFAKNIEAATLADAIIHDWPDVHRIFDRGLSIFECEPCNERAVAEIRDLYQEILSVKDLPVHVTANGIAIMNAIQRCIHGKAGTERKR